MADRIPSSGAVRSAFTLECIDMVAFDIAAYFKLITSIDTNMSYMARYAMDAICSTYNEWTHHLPEKTWIVDERLRIVRIDHNLGQLTVWRDAKKGFRFFSYKPKDIGLMHKAIGLIFWKGLTSIKEYRDKYKVKLNKTWTMSFTTLYALSGCILASVPGGPQMILDMMVDGEIDT